MTQKKLDETAVKYNKTKDPKYKDQWYKLIEKTYGSNTIKRRIVSVSSCHKRDDGTYLVIGQSELLWFMWHTTITFDHVSWTTV